MSAFGSYHTQQSIRVEKATSCNFQKRKGPTHHNQPSALFISGRAEGTPMLRGMEVHATLYWDYFLQITTSKLASGYRIAEGFPELHCDKYKTRVICTVQYHTVFGDRVPCFALVSDPRTQRVPSGPTNIPHSLRYAEISGCKKHQTSTRCVSFVNCDQQLPSEQHNFGMLQ